MHANILCERDGNIAIVTINRPQKANAMNREIIMGLTELLLEFSRDDSVRGIIITGVGKAFTAGADINLMNVGPEEGRQFITMLQALMRAVRFNDKPVLAAINGYCFGGGLEMAVSCDLCVAAESATFGMQEVNLGIPSVIEAALFPFMVGLAKSREMLLTGNVIDAAEALRIGLISKVVPKENVLAEAKTMMRQIIKNSQWVVGLQKRLINRWLENAGLEESIKVGIDCFAYSLIDEETRKNLSAALGGK